MPKKTHISAATLDAVSAKPFLEMRHGSRTHGKSSCGTGIEIVQYVYLSLVPRVTKRVLGAPRRKVPRDWRCVGWRVICETLKATREDLPNGLPKQRPRSRGEANQKHNPNNHSTDKCG
jgi:hypothetical protein